MRTGTAKKNRSATLEVDDNVRLPDKDIHRGKKLYEDWHWSAPASKVIDWGDKDYPKMLIECGRLVRMHIRAPDAASGNPNHPRRKRDTMIELSQEMSENSHLTYDPDHPDERLYLLVDPRASVTLARRFWQENGMTAMPLGHLASIAGGRHGRRDDYPKLMVKPVGVLTALVYRTHKKGDEMPNDPRSFYIHAVGELSSCFPILACDARGRLWVAGGNTTAPTPGITD